ncbi:MAG: inner membrane protein YpjD [Polyangiaceae bacterium]
MHDPAVSLVVANFLFFATSLAYLAAAALFLGFLTGAKAASSPNLESAALNAATPSRFAPGLLAVGAAMHGAHIYVASELAHVCPVEGIHSAMSVVSFFVCCAYLALRARWRIDVLGAFVAPLALTSLLASRFVGGGDVTPGPAFKSALLPLHVAINMLGVALFSLACGAAITYLVQEKQVKKKRLEGVFQRLPPLDSLDRAEHKLLLWSFPLLTIGIVTGAFWTKKLEAAGGLALLHAAFGYGAWIICAAVLLLRAGAGWRGRRAAYGTIAGFGFTVLLLLLYLLRTPAEAAVALLK